MKLGHWTRVGPVFERADGMRVHIGGSLIRLATGTFIDGSLWPESQRVRRWIAIHGGNHRRGVLAWANSKAEE